MSVRCRAEGCGALIEFVELRSGKKHPVESLEAETYRLLLAEPAVGLPAGAPIRVVVTTEGDVLRGVVLPMGESRGVVVTGYDSHFATCPGANVMRKTPRAGTSSAPRDAGSPGSPLAPAGGRGA